MAQTNGSVRGSNQSLDLRESAQMRKIGEDLIMEKINKIFDEVAGDRQDFEESYISISNSASKTRKNRNSLVGGVN